MSIIIDKTFYDEDDGSELLLHTTSKNDIKHICLNIKSDDDKTCLSMQFNEKEFKEFLKECRLMLSKIK